MVKSRIVDGIEIPYELESIKSVAPDLVGRATLFAMSGRPWHIVKQLDGRIRDILLSDYHARSPEQFPELIMYSGSGT